MIRPTVARVDLGAIARNFRRIREHLAREQGAGVFSGETGGQDSRPLFPGVIAVVKANAYGHGASQVARALLIVHTPASRSISSHRMRRSSSRRAQKRGADRA